MSARTFRSVVALAMSALVVSPMAVVIAPAAAAAPCGPYSPLDCEVLVVDPTVDGGYSLDFDGTEGALGDATGVGTGFTLTQPSTTGTYKPELLQVAGGALRDTTTPGIQFTTNNTLDNGLGVALAPPAGELDLQTRLLDIPVSSNRSEQAGLWLGTDQDNLVKLVVVSRSTTGAFNIQLAREVAGVVGTANELSMPTTTTFPVNSDVDLQLLVDPVARTATGRYSINDAAMVTLGTLALPPGVLTAVNPALDGAGVAAGVFSTQRSRLATAGPIVYSFDSFSVAEAAPAPLPDTEAPAAPATLTATAGSNTVELAWDAVVADDLAGYFVYRSETAAVATTGTALNGAVPLTDLAFSDPSGFFGATYHYAVVAVDAAGNRSAPVTAGPAELVRPEGERVLAVDFLKDTAPVTGYVADTGAAFDEVRGYGWLDADALPARTPVNASLNTRTRTGVTDSRQATLTHMQYGDIVGANPATGVAQDVYWEAELPAGRYAVTTALGDIRGGTGYDGNHLVRAEGTPIGTGFVGSDARRFDEHTVEVDVTDGLLTIDAVGGTNTKIAYLEVVALEEFDTTAPAIPTDVTATAGDAQVTVDWSAVADEDLASYWVYRIVGDAPTAEPLATVDTPATSYTESALTNGTAYHYVVTAVDADGNESAISAMASATPVAAADTIAPAAPSGLSATSDSAGVSVQWLAPSDSAVAGYNLYRGVGDAAPDTAGTPLATVTDLTHLDADVTAGETYSYAVTAVDASDNESAPSATATVTLDAEADATAPGAPTALAADLDGTTASLAWTAPDATDIARYQVIDRGSEVAAGVYDETVLDTVTGTGAVLSNLAPGEFYSFLVRAVDTSGNVSAASNVVEVAVPVDFVCETTDGWVGEYFDNQTLSGTPAAIRCDAAIDFDYGNGGPAGVGVDDFSVRWTRDITTVAGTYAFSSRSDDGLRISVDGVTVVDEFVDRGPSNEPSVTQVPLTAGSHTVVVEYYENGGGALVEVDYALVDDDITCAPGQWKAQYFNGQDTFTGTPAGEECVDAIDEDWGLNGPDGVGDNNFSVRWTSTRTLEAGAYELQARADDGIRVLVDGDLVLDEYRDQGPDQLFTEQVVLGAGEHTFQVDYYENGGGALARVGISRLDDAVTCPAGWVGEYFDNQTLDGTPVRTACDDAISFDYGLNGPAGVGADNFSVRWSREITTVQGTYAFSGRSDDGLRVTVDGVLVIDEFIDRGVGAPTVAEVPLSAGTHDVVVEYYENDGGALVDVSYALVADAEVCEPGQWTAQYFDGQRNYEGTPALVECVATIDEDWGSGGPEGVGSNDFSARWSTTRSFEPGSHLFRATADDGIRIFVDGAIVLDEYRDQGPDQEFTSTVALDGEHTIVVEYYENGGGALARVAIEKILAADLPPAAPATTTATVVDGEVVIDFSAVTETDLTGYRVYRSETSPVDRTVAPLSGSTPLSVTTYTDATAVAGVTYHYAVVAVDAADQESAPGPEVTATVEVATPQVSESWNFQPAAAPVPAGFTADSGAAYSTSTGRGFVTQATAGTATPTPLNLATNTRDRNRSGIVQELDTFVHLQYGDIVNANVNNGVLTAGAWERDLPNGTYEVSLSVGDQPSSGGYDSTHVVRAEGQVILPAFTSTAATEFNTATSTVVVSDGRLTIDAIGGSNTKLNWIRIVTSGPDTTAPAKVTDLVATGRDSAVVLGWAPSTSADVVGYRVYRSETLPVSVEGPGIAGTDLLTGTSFTDTTATNLTTYRYAVVAIDAAGNRSEVTTSAEVTPQPFSGLSVGIDFGTATMSPEVGYLLDYGQAYGPRVNANQGSGLTYGWVNQGATTPLSIVGNGRIRTRTAIDPILNSMIHLQYGDVVGTNGVKAPAAWEIQVPDGVYEVSVTAGDEPGTTSGYDSTHAVNIENQIGIEAFQATAAAEYRTATTVARVEDGRLTVSAVGGVNTKLTHLRVTQLTDRPTVTSVNPANRATAALTTAGVATSISVPGDGVGVDPASLQGNVSLVEVSTGIQVVGTAGSSGGNDVVNFSPTGALKPSTAYRFTVTDGVLSEDGAPFEEFTSVFTTGDGVIVAPEEFTPLVGVNFEKVRQNIDSGYIASMAFGPDGKLYASSIGASLKRYDVAPDGSLSNPQQLAPALFGRAVIGMVFDTSATAGNLGVWVTHATADLGNEQTQWSSTVSYLSGPNLETVTDVFVGLPRSNKDHLSNSIGYGPGGDLYFLQGSNQAGGDLDGAWGTRGEKALTAAMLHFDPDHPAVRAALTGGSPVNVQTEGIANAYDPYATGAPLQIYSTGIRNAYDFNYHSNGHIYVPTNGTAGGANSPGVDVTYSGGQLSAATRIADPRIPAAASVNGQDLTSNCQDRIAREPGLVMQDTLTGYNHQTQRDFLFDVEQGGYYGHPNPARCEFVLNGGSASTEGRGYTGTVPVDPNYRGVAYDFAFNKSPNGVLEYQGGAFGGQLQNRLVVVRFSNNDDLTFLQVDQNSGAVLGAQVQEGITGVANSQIGGVGGFNDPLEVVEDPTTGNLYVNSYDRSGGQQGLFLLRVPSDQQAPSLSADVEELVFSTVASGTDGPDAVVVTNSGADAVTLSSTLTGANAASFQIAAGGTGTLQPGASTTVSVRFTPSGAVGYREARLIVSAGADTAEVGLYGLSAVGQFGSAEPTLTNVLRTLGHPVNTGWSGLAGGVDPAPKGDEIEVELFEKAGSAPVAMTPIASYAPMEDLPFGWYTGNGVLNEVGALANGQQQTLYPRLLRGGTTFDPAAAAFGLYYDSNTFNRVGYTEDRLNTGDVAHRVRIYAATRRDGSLIANAYVIAFEDANNGDYQDYMFLLTGVRPAGEEPPVDPEPGITDAIKVNFQNAAAAVPTGYVRDYGQPFGFRTGAEQGSGLRYGWIEAATQVDLDLSVGGTAGNGRDRNLVADQRLDTFMHMQATDIAGTFNGTKADGAWEVEVPNGRYTVTVAAGDPAVNTADAESHTLDVEDVRAINAFVPSGAAGSTTRSTTQTVVVDVVDGRLSLDASAGTNTKVHYVDIVPVVTEEPDTVQVNFQAAGAATPEGWQADNGQAYTDARGYGWVNLSSGAPVDRTAAARTRAGTGSILDRTFNIMQSDVAASAAPDGAWEFAVPDGAYNVQVSVGDSGFADSTHSVNAEGVRVISQFVPAAAGDYQVSDETVNVTDGRLSITPGPFGSNTKIQWIRITGTDLLEDTIDPSIDVQVTGDAAPGGGFYDKAVVTVVAGDTGGSGLAGTTVSVDGAAAVPYTSPLTVTGAGDHTVTVVATDGAGNATTETATFTIVVIELGDGVLTSQNPEAAPFTDRYVMSRTESTVQDPVTKNTTTVIMRNTGTEPVVVSGIVEPGEGFDVTTAPTFPVTVAVNGILQVGITFTGTSPNAANKVFEDTLSFTTDSANGPLVSVELAGIAQDRAEGGAEPDNAEIARAFGWGTDILNPTSTRTASQQLNNQGRVETLGDEVLSPYWQRLNTSQPVTVRQLAALHSCCTSTATFFTHAKDSTTTQSRLTHNGAWAQSLLPRINGSATNPAFASFTPTSTVFGFKIDPEWSDPTKNNKSADRCVGGAAGVETETCKLGHHVRVWPVEDRDGVAVPGQYMVTMDYSGINYDFNDNVYLVTNLVPEGQVDTTPPPAPATASATLAGPSVQVTWSGVTAADLAGYQVERSSGTTWTPLTTTPVTGTSYTDAAAPAGATVSYRIISVDATGNRSAFTQTGPVTIPTPPPGAFTPIRVNAGGPAVTTGGVAYAADSGFTGGKTYTNPSVTQIAGTTDDALYLTERSSTTNLGTFAYGFGVPAGEYTVRLHFAEIYHGATGGGLGGTGKRVLDVNAEGGAVEVDDLDLNAVAAPMTAVVREFPITVSDGTLNLAFSASVNQPKVSAIEVLQVSAPPADTTAPAAPGAPTATSGATGVALTWPAVVAADLAGYRVERQSSGGTFTSLSPTLLTGTSFTDASAPVGVPLGYRVLAVDTTGNVSAPSATTTVTVPAPPTEVQPVRINAGGPAVTTDGLQWAADTAFTGGKSYTNPAVTSIAGTTDDALYLTERSATTNLGSFSYAVPRPNGQYTVRLHFAEIYHGATGGGLGGTGKRVLSVNAEGGAVEVANLDINAQVAPMTALVREFPVDLTDGTLNLAFTASVNQPKVSAIEVLAGGTGGGTGGGTTPSEPTLQTQFSFTSLAAQPVSNSEAQGLTVGGVAYSFGGFDSQKGCCTPTSRAYKLADGASSWTAIAPLPHLAGNGAAGTGVTHAGIATDGTNLYLAGGYVSANGTTGQTFGTVEVYQYAPATNAWTRLPNLPTASASGVLGWLDGSLHFAGGTTPARTSDRTEHYVLDAGATTWRTAAPLPAPRNHAGAAVADGRWYVVGGQTGHDGTSTTHAQVWSYASAANAWRVEPSLPQARGHAAVFALEGDVVIAGGMPTNGTGSNQVDRLRPGSSAWSPVTPLPFARSSAMAGALSGGRWLYSTGGTGAGVLATPVG